MNTYFKNIKPVDISFVECQEQKNVRLQGVLRLDVSRAHVNEERALCVSTSPPHTLTLIHTHFVVQFNSLVLSERHNLNEYDKT